MPITLGILITTVAVSFYAFNKPEVMGLYMMNPYRIVRNRQFYRLVTSGFLHLNHIHLLFNMFSFYFFGGAMEQIFQYLFGTTMGSIYFIVLYLAAIIVSDIPTLVKHKHNPAYNSLGASGGVSAVVFAFIIFLPLEDICFYGVLCFPGFILGIVYIGYSYYQGKRANDNINHDAHLYGAFFGLIFSVLVYPQVIGNFIDQISQWRMF